MLTREKPTFRASRIAPNPKEVTYWIDLTEGPDGQVIKTWNGKEWIIVNKDLNDDQSEAIEQLQSDVQDLEDSKADKATTLAGYGITDAYTKSEVYTQSQTNSQIDSKIAALVNSAPAALDTLDELAAALGDDANFATTVTNQLANKLDTSTYNTDKATFATKTELNGKANTTHTHTAAQVSGLATVATSGSYNDLTNKPTIPSTSGLLAGQIVTALPASPDANTLYVVNATDAVSIYFGSLQLCTATKTA